MKMPSSYSPSQYEADIYSLWEQTKSFQPRGDGKPFSIVMPPPNANGNLHMGHALTIAIEDIIIRYQRLKGSKTLFVPGADHAGFETQVVYERELEKAGKSRFDFSREELHSQIWDFVAQNKGNYESQLRKLGTSCDWDSYTFTLDDKIVKRAYATFKKLWDDKLIYRGERLVNFCTHHGTAFADIEVQYKEEKGSLWDIRYPLEGGNGEEAIIVATTRPETLLGDVAVAVNPSDERYKDLIGKSVKLPLTDRLIPIIADDFVDINFGSGAVKITPAHDINDYDVAERADLDKRTVIDFEGKMTGEIPDKYRGLSVLEARQQVIDDLKEQGYLAKTNKHEHSLAHCYKCGTVLEPLLRQQWFINMQPLAKPAIDALEQGKITFYPETKKRQLIQYLKGLRDWNISRQIVWGIPIPAFQNVNDETDWIYDETVSEETISRGDKIYRRDNDVFDTWFSSSSWPFATLGYPEDKTKADFYPNSLIETGFDILMPWVSRMIMMGLYVTGDVPFKSAYLHGLILDEHGQKMSKSKGNVISPIEVLEEYGSDALRMGIISGQTPGSNQPFGYPKVVGARNFCNKLWNISRYIADLTGNEASLFMERPNPSTPADHWILTKLQQSQLSMEKMLDDYRFSEAYDVIYHFVWDDLADWYLEASKSQTNTSVLAWVLYSVLHIAHPFAPFVSETIWQTLRPDNHEVVVLAKSTWPKLAVCDNGQSADFEIIKAIISEIREISSAIKVPKPEVRYYASDLIRSNENVIAKLCNVRSIEESSEQTGSGLHLTSTDQIVWLAVSDNDIKNYKTSLDDKKTALKASIKLLGARLSNDSYIKNAPADLVSETRDKLLQDTAQLDAVNDSYARLG